MDLIDTAIKYAHECSGEFNPDIRDAFIHGAEYIMRKDYNDYKSNKDVVPTNEYILL